jgi:hypothetical protein
MIYTRFVFTREHRHVKKPGKGYQTGGGEDSVGGEGQMMALCQVKTRGGKDGDWKGDADEREDGSRPGIWRHERRARRFWRRGAVVWRDSGPRQKYVFQF